MNNRRTSLLEEVGCQLLKNTFAVGIYDNFCIFVSNVDNFLYTNIMKQLFTFMFLALAMLVGCNGTEEVPTTTSNITIHSQSPITVSYEGGEQKIGYLIKNPVEGARMTGSFNSYWVTDITIHDAFISFVVDRNTDKTSRTGVLKFNYAGVSTTIEIVQEGKLSDYDYEFRPTSFGGEYRGNRGDDNYNYYVQVGNAPITVDNAEPNGTYYYFDLYAGKRGGDAPVVPNGTYILDPSGNGVVGTFSKSLGVAHVNDDNGEPVVEYQMVSGEVTISDNKLEALVYMSDGTSHHIVYEGSLAIPSVVESPAYGSKLTEDYIFDYPAAYMRLFYYGDEYGIGADYWSVALMTDSNAMNGDYFQVKIITDSCDNPSYDTLAGTYTPCSDLDPQKNCFIQGLLEGRMYIGSQCYYVEQGFIDNSKGAPIYGGEIKFEVDGNSFTVTLDCIDDNNHKIKGTFRCTGAEFYDRSNR